MTVVLACQGLGEKPLQEAADILNRNAKITILYGGGCINAQDELLKIYWQLP